MIALSGFGVGVGFDVLVSIEFAHGNLPSVAAVDRTGGAQLTDKIMVETGDQLSLAKSKRRQI